MDRFDTRLKAICEEFNHIEETAKEKVENKGRIIHIGKEVFYSDKSEEKKQAVFSGLINGGYISPSTSIDIFMGIFDETVFTRPVLWIKVRYHSCTSFICHSEQIILLTFGQNAPTAFKFEKASP